MASSLPSRPSERPSLQKLQALDKECSGFTPQLARLAAIIEIPLDSVTAPSRVRTANGRLVWALRWLLRNLRAAGGGGIQARASTQTWTLLTNIFNTLEPSLISHTLISNKFLAIVEQAVAEARAGPQTKTQDENLINQASNDGFQETFEPAREGSQEASETRSKKRKRGQDTEISVMSQEHGTLENENPLPLTSTTSNPSTFSQLFLAIDTCLYNLIQMASPANNDLDHCAKQYMRSVMATDPEQAARLLGHWLAVHSTQFSAMETDDTKISSLFTVLHIWNASIESSIEPSSNTAIVISKHCLSPAVWFLSIARLWKNAGSLPSLDRDDVAQVEFLLAKHFFIPSKAIHRDISQPLASEEGVLDEGKMTLSGLFQPLIEQLSWREENKESINVDIEALPALFDIAIRCCSLSNNKRRAAESPWLQAVFTALTAHIMIDDDTLNIKDFPRNSLKAFEQLLKLVVHNKIIIDKDFMERAIVQTIRRDLPSNRDMRWSLIAQFVLLHPEFFLPPRSTIQVESMTMAWSHDEIFSELTREAWLLQDWNHSEITQKTSESPNESNFQLYTQTKKEVVIPLMKAYVSARDLEGFCLRWHSHLKSFLQSSRERSLMSVWQDEDLNCYLSQVLHTSMTSSRVIDMIKYFFTDIVLDVSQPSFEVSQMSSSLHLLNAILSAIPDEFHAGGWIEDLLYHKRVSLLLRDCVAIIESKQITQLPIRRAGWKLLQTCHRLQLNQQEQEHCMSFGSLCDSLIPPLITSLKSAQPSSRWDKVDEGLAGLACIGSIMVDMRGRYFAYDDKPALISELLSALHGILSDKNADVDAIKSCYFANMLARYPILLSHTEQETLEQKRVRAYVLEAMAALTNSPLRDPHDNLWKVFTHQAEDEDTSLIAEIMIRPLARSKAPSPSDDQDPTLFYQTYLEVRPNIITRRTRERILDRAVASIPRQISSSGHLEWSRILSLMLHLLGFPAGPAQIVTSPDCMWTIAQSLDKGLSHGGIPTEEVKPLLDLFRRLTVVVLRDQVAGMSIEHNQHYLQNLQVILMTVLEDKAPLGSNPALLVLCVTACNELTLLGKIGRITNPDGRFAKTLCSKIRTELNVLCPPGLVDTYLGKKTSKVATLLEAISDLSPGILTQSDYDTSIVRAALRVWDVMKMTQVQTDDQRSGVIAFAAVSKLRMATSLSASTSPVTAPTTLAAVAPTTNEAIHPTTPGEVIGFLQQTLSYADREIVCKAMLQEFKAAGIATRHKLLEDLIWPRWRAQGYPMLPVELELLYTIVSTTKSKTFSNLISSLLVPKMTAKMAKELPRSTVYAVFHHQSSILACLLRHHVVSQDQFSIDATLLAVARACSPSGPALNKSYAPHIFLALTRTLQALLTHHRRALRRRFDVVMVAMQSLLRCLFVPTVSPTGTAGYLADHLPPWAPKRAGDALKAAPAAAYARLLTTLCDPALASVRTPSGSNPHANLTDATRKARKYVGQYVPLVLMELCRCLLVGRLRGEAGVRAALLPGVWAVFAVVEKEALTAVVEGMPGAERSVLRGLREEWKRVGGGGGGKGGRSG